MAKICKRLKTSIRNILYGQKIRKILVQILTSVPWSSLNGRQGWVKTGISQDKTIQDRDKILKLKTRQTQDRHIAVKTIQDFQVIKNFGSRQVKNFNFSKFTRQDRSRQDSCQEIVKKNSRNGLFLTDFGSEC